MEEVDSKKLKNKLLMDTYNACNNKEKLKFKSEIIKLIAKKYINGRGNCKTAPMICTELITNKLNNMSIEKLIEIYSRCFIEY